jgi:NDP-sugar pyrophosphorylase family protein
MQWKDGRCIEMRKAMGTSTHSQSVTAAILAGGLGTRLRPAVTNVPKALADVNGRPFITYLLDQLADAGVSHAVLLAGYKAADIHSALGTRYGEATLTYSVEDRPLGTAGALRLALPQLESDVVLLMNGDSYCEIDLADLLHEHRRNRADWTMAVTCVADTNRFGRVEMNGAGRITQFKEKQEAAGAGRINAGIHALARAMIAEIPPGQCLSLERDLLPEWIRRCPVYGFQTSGRFLDIGTPASYAAAASFFQSFSREPKATARATVAFGSRLNDD